jgi:hypothetical protein
VVQVVGELVVGQVAAHAVFEEPRGEAEDAHVVAGDLLGQGLGEALHRGLAGAVVDGRLDHLHAGQRADVEDDAGLAPDHPAQGRLRRQEGALHVGVHHLVPVFLLEEGEGQVLRHPRVVDQDVEAAPRLVDLGQHRLGRGDVEDRSLERSALGACGLDGGDGGERALFAAVVRERDPGTLSGERHADGVAQAPRPTRDQGALALEQLAHLLCILARAPAITR